jgi:hypothetical protein
LITFCCHGVDFVYNDYICLRGIGGRDDMAYVAGRSADMVATTAPAAPAMTYFGFITVDDPYNKDSTVKTSGSRTVYNKFRAHFWY